MGNIIFWIIVIGVILLAIIFTSQVRLNRRKKINAITKDPISLGNYIFGLPNQNNKVENVECEVTEENLVLFQGFFSPEIGKIPRNAINAIFIDDKSQIHQRLSALGLLAVDPFAFAAPLKKERNKYCLVIDWEDDNFCRYNTVFELEGKDSGKK